MYLEFSEISIYFAVELATIRMKRIYIIGYMGAGKSTFGKSLALRMNLKSIDTDHFIENRYRKKIGEIFAVEGEERFREIEHRVLLEISEYEDVVISTGGGLPCFNDNMTIMNNTGITVYLEAPVDELAIRLGASKNVRPVLEKRSGSALKDFIKENLARRILFYEQAHIRFNSSSMNSNKEVKMIANSLETLINKR